MKFFKFQNQLDQGTKIWNACKKNVNIFIKSESVWKSKGRNPKALKVISHFASWDCQGISNVWKTIYEIKVL
jgi:hypothetical protein